MNAACGYRYPHFRFAVLFACLVFTHVVSAQDLPAYAREPSLRDAEINWRDLPEHAGNTYSSVVLNPQAVHYFDPNIWVYTHRFARRFRMPDEWIAGDLEGAEALAFRLAPDYQTCGWGGDKNVCNAQQKLCELDVYFDHNKQNLPWDERMRWSDLDIHASSANFIANVSALSRQQGKTGLPREPFFSPVKQEELRWRLTPVVNTSLIGSAFLKAYDRSIFDGFSVLTFNAFCNEPLRLDLQTTEPDNKTSYHRIIFPMQWREKIRALVQVEKDKRDRLDKNALIK